MNKYQKNSKYYWMMMMILWKHATCAMLLGDIMAYVRVLRSHLYLVCPSDFEHYDMPPLLLSTLSLFPICCCL